MEVPELIQSMRLLSLAEVRKRLEKLQAKHPADYAVIVKLYGQQTKTP